MFCLFVLMFSFIATGVFCAYYKPFNSKVVCYIAATNEFLLVITIILILIISTIIQVNSGHGGGDTV